MFLRLWTRAAQHGGGSVRSWLFRIATNLALNQLRSGRRRRHQPLEPLEPAGAAAEPDWMVDASATGPDVLAERAERGVRLDRLISALPADKREVFRLVYEERKELAQVAEELGIPVGTVKSRLFYARRGLAEAAREMEWDPEVT